MGRILRLGPRAGISPTGADEGAVGEDGYRVERCYAQRAKLRAVLVAIDRLSLLVTHLAVAVEPAPAALLPPPIRPEER
jgi:hypothetical protein